MTSRPPQGPREPAVTFGRNLAEERRRQGLSRAELARRATLSEGHLGDIERGISLPKSEARAKIVSVLDLEGEWVLFGQRAPLGSGSVLVKLTDGEWDVVRALVFLRGLSAEEVATRELSEALAARAREGSVTRALEALDLYREQATSE